MYRKTIIVSVLLHLGVGALALTVATRDRGHRATAVAVINDKKARKPPKPARPRPPPPAAPRPRVAPRAEKAREEPSRPEPAPRDLAPASPALDSGLALDNAGEEGDGPVIPVQRQSAAPAPAPRQQPAPAPRPRQPRPGPGRPAEEICDEPATKPAPIARPTEIEYTAQARSSGVEGRLILRVTISADGSVIKVEVVRGVEPSLDAAAVAAVRTWTFRPSTRCGKPVAGGTFTLARRFELGD